MTLGKFFKESELTPLSRPYRHEVETMARGLVYLLETWSNLKDGSQTLGEVEQGAGGGAGGLGGGWRGRDQALLKVKQANLISASERPPLDFFLFET